MYLSEHFNLYIIFVHFVLFRYLQQIQKLNFVFYFLMNFMILKNEIKVCLKFYKKKIIFVICGFYTEICNIINSV